jgi:hypothetical protein
VRERNQLLRASLPGGLEENISCSNYGSAPSRFFGQDSSGETSTISDQSRSAGRWALGHYQHKRGKKMKHRYKQLGKLSLANMLRARHVRKGNGTATNRKRRLLMKAKSSRFDRLVARYYPAVYSFASRLTDDPREAIELTRDAFSSTREQLTNRRDKNALASILILAVIRAGLAAA